MNNENLKEAIGKYIESKELVLMAYPPEYIEDVKKDMEIAFRAGAEWMAGQGGEAEIGYWNQTGLSIRLDKALERLGYEDGDKVVVQIRKK